MKRLLLLILSIIEVCQLFAQTVSSNSIQTKSNLIYYNASPYSGKVVAYNSQGQIISKYEVKEGVLSGMYETFYESKDFTKAKYQDTAQVSRYTNEIQLKQKEVIKLESDSVQRALQINDFINYKLGGPKKFSKMRAKNDKGKLKNTDKSKRLFDDLVFKEFELKEISSTKKTLISDIKRIQDQLTLEFKKKEFIPAKELIYEVNNGLKNGKYTKYSNEGEILEEGIYQNNKQEGEWKYYHTNGNLEASGKFAGGDGGNLGNTGIPKNGREGLWKFYYESGKIEGTRPYNKGLIVGLSIEYYENGNKKEEVNYVNNIRQDQYYLYHENGKLMEEGYFVNDKVSGRVVFYFENGLKKWDGVYQKGILNGLSKEYNNLGHLVYQKNWVNGKINGVLKEFYSNGKLKSEAMIINGTPHGASKAYYENGNLQISCTFDSTMMTENKVIGDLRTFREDGSLESHVIIDKKGSITDKMPGKVTSKYNPNKAQKCTWCGRSFQGLGYTTPFESINRGVTKDCTARKNLIDPEALGLLYVEWFCSQKCAEENCYKNE